MFKLLTILQQGVSIRQSLTNRGGKGSVFEDIPDEIVVFVESREVVMPSAVNADEGDLLRVDLLQRLAMADGYQPVPGAVDDIGMAFYIR